MKISIERKPDKLLKVPIHVLSVGTNKYHYERLEDVLMRIAVIFEPHQGKVNKHNTKFPKSKRFPLGEEIIKVLSTARGYQSLDVLMEQIKTPRPYKKTVWISVLSKLAKKKKIKIVRQGEEDRYGI